MAEAKRQYHNHKIYAMARYLARRAVENEIRRQGGKVSHYSAKQLIERADKYVKEHSDEIMREVVMRRCERWLAPMRLEEKGSAKMPSRKPHGMGFFRALFGGE
jgi:hypothetical protein